MVAPYQYIVLHQSCGNLAGVAAAQAAHAASESIRTLPIDPGTHVVILKAETSDDLVSLSNVLKDADIHHVLCREPDEPYNGAAVALGVEPMEREKVRGFFSHLKPLR